jgi:hypothetical protein
MLPHHSGPMGREGVSGCLLVGWILPGPQWKASVARNFSVVIASEAKQSRAKQKVWIASLRSQ